MPVSVSEWDSRGFEGTCIRRGGDERLSVLEEVEGSGVGSDSES